jgi:D-alanyl-D-alanine carboxypeptidase
MGWLGMTRRSRGVLTTIAAAALSLGIATIQPREACAASLLVDAGTGAIIFADAANHLWYPASLTKMMTVYVALREIQVGRLSFDDKIVVSKKAAAVSPVRFGLVAGQKITVRQAINAAIVASGNDAAVALAEKVGGTEENFADMMTLAARGIGMTRTTFRNATGLPDADQVTTARDMALLAMALLRDHPAHYSLFNQRSVTIAGRSRATVNGILSSYNGADGFKTGFTCGSGYNLVASAMRGNRRVIGVVLGSGSRTQRLSEMTKLLDAGFARDVSANISLAALLVVAGDEGRPPSVLKGPACVELGENDTEVAATTGVGSWDVVFGPYTDKAKAQMALAEARRQLGTIGSTGTATISSKPHNGVTQYSALIANLTQRDAVKACKALWAKILHCQALGPQDLRNSKVASR